MKSPSPATGRRRTLTVVFTIARRSRRCLVGSVFLNKRGADCQQDHQRDYDRCPHIAKEIGNHRQCKQKCVERASGATPDFLEDCRLLLPSDEVEPIAFQAPIRFFGCEPCEARSNVLAGCLGRKLANCENVPAVRRRSN